MGGAPGAGLRLCGAGAGVLLGGGVRFCADDWAGENAGLSVATTKRAATQCFVDFMVASVVHVNARCRKFGTGARLSRNHALFVPSVSSGSPRGKRHEEELP
jgi:hypothetical protein